MVLDVVRGMPPLGGMMSDEQVADVVDYLRSHFGNDYRDRVSAAAVRAARPPSPSPWERLGIVRRAVIAIRNAYCSAAGQDLHKPGAG